VKIIDTGNGDIVGAGDVGELCTRGYHVMQAYFEKPEATAAAIDAEGWLHTGDLGSMDARGYCRLVGRLKDMVIRGGENLFPAEIEAVLIEHAAVADVAVIGVPELHAHVRARLAGPKAPRYWVFLGEFPLTGSGKIQKFVLRERWARGEFQCIDVAASRGAC
jgi:fatty-acyl-CoA synthase